MLTQRQSDEIRAKPKIALHLQAADPDRPCPGKPSADDIAAAIGRERVAIGIGKSGVEPQGIESVVERAAQHAGLAQCSKRRENTRVERCRRAVERKRTGRPLRGTRRVQGVIEDAPIVGSHCNLLLRRGRPGELLRHAQLVDCGDEYPLACLLVAVGEPDQLIEHNHLVRRRLAVRLQADLLELGPARRNLAPGQHFERADEMGRSLIDEHFKLQIADIALAGHGARGEKPEREREHQARKRGSPGDRTKPRHASLRAHFGAGCDRSGGEPRGALP